MTSCVDLRMRNLAAAGIAVALAACGGDSNPAALETADCQAEVNLFPTPVASASSPFLNVDDGFLYVAFDPAFDFSFYGSTYDGVFLNTNGGMTFASGSDWFDEAVADIDLPGIAVFWGDMDASSAPSRANQMKYQVCTNTFVVTYNQLQDYDEATWNNTATVTLEASGKITVQHGTVLSQDIAVGVFDGTHTDDRFVSVQNSYAAYSTTGTGTILFDSFGSGPDHAGQLDNRTITYNP
jgi:hypothetical protein